MNVSLNSIFDDFIFSHYPRSGYPFYDVYRNDQGYSLEIALAGFHKEEIDVSAEDGFVYIKTERNTEEPMMKPVIQNIAKRDINVKYKIPEHHKIDMVVFHDGILKIWMQKELPDHMKRISLEIE